MYRNNILNFEESTIILNAYTKKKNVWTLIECTTYVSVGLQHVNFHKYIFNIYIMLITLCVCVIPTRKLAYMYIYLVLIPLYIYKYMYTCVCALIWHILITFIYMYIYIYLFGLERERKWERDDFFGSMQRYLDWLTHDFVLEARWRPLLSIISRKNIDVHVFTWCNLSDQYGLMHKTFSISRCQLPLSFIVINS